MAFDPSLAMERWSENPDWPEEQLDTAGEADESALNGEVCRVTYQFVSWV